MNIGVLTFHRCVNYGSYWQARCLVEGLRARGHDVEVLDHDCSAVWKAELHCAFQPKLPERTPARELPSYKSKIRKFQKMLEHLPLSNRFSLHQPEAAQQYDAIVVGSDEVWNFRHPWYSAKPLFFGEGLNAERLISYAASFGNHCADDGISDDWLKSLQRFSAISVRDENSRALVQQYMGEKAKLVLDPCLQFPEFARIEGPTAAEPYAIVYGHSFPQWVGDRIRTWSRLQGIRLLSIGYSNDWADEQRIEAGPIEFARLFRGASAVATNFFHGCVFALLNCKPWIAVPSDYRSIKVTGLAALVGAEDRVVSEATGDLELKELLATTQQTSVAERIQEHRGRSSAFLDAALA